MPLRIKILKRSSSSPISDKPISALEEVYQEACGEARSLCIFLTQYGALLLGCGSTCIRLEKNINRIAKAFGMEAEIYIMPRHLQLSVWEKEHTATVSALEAVAPVGINFEMNTRLSELSWEIADGRITFQEALNKFAEIKKGTKRNPYILLLLVALANASFCRLFGGDLMAMATVALATAIGFQAKTTMLSWRSDLRAVVFLCSLLSAFIAGLGVWLSIGDVPRIAVATSVLYLVPGIPFINSFSDMINRHYICAFGRFMDAVVLTCCLSAGLVVAMKLMGLSMF